MDQENQALATTCASHSKRSEQPSKSQLIRDWILKLALNAGAALDADAIGVYTAIWSEGFADLPYRALEAAFRRTLQSCRYWPVKVSDVREHVTVAEQNAASAEAEVKWTRVLEYIRLFWNPDYPGGISRGAWNITPRTMHAIRAAGGLAEIADCPREYLHFRRTAFLEAYARWEQLLKDAPMLPEGSPVKVLLAGSWKALPRSADPQHIALLREQAAAIEAKYSTEGSRP
jgi:hypothetical protein